MPRRAVHSLADRSGSDSDECMFDQTNLLQRRRLNITRMTNNGAPISGQRLTVARTVNLCLSFFALGLCFVIPTATIAGLQYRTSSGEEQIEFIYTARYGGYIVGCFAGGFLFNCYNRQFLLFLALLATAIGVLIMPFCRVLSFLMTCTCVTGVTMGLLDTGGNVWLLDLWGRKSAPFMQMMHFCLGLGALVAPLVAQPFIGPYSEIGAYLTLNSSRTILPPMGPHLSNGAHHQLIKRELPHLDLKNMTLPIQQNITIKEIRLNLTTTTLPTPSTTTELLPKKPQFADSQKINDKWDRNSNLTGGNSSLKVSHSNSNKTTTNTTATPISTDKSEYSSKPIMADGNSKSTTEGPSSTPFSTSSSTASFAAVTPNIALTFASPAVLENMPSKNTGPQSKSLRKDLPDDGTPNNDSTMKTTSSTVPTQITKAADEQSTAFPTPKHHTTKKVLGEDEQEESWIEATKSKIQKSGKFEIAYGILAAYVLLVSIVFLLFLCMNPRETKSKQEEELDDLHQSSRMRLPMIILMCSFFFLYMGVEVAVGETLQSFQTHHQDSNRLVSGEQLIYIFWGSFALARGVSIFVSMSASCRSMLIADLVLCLTAAVTLVVGARNECARIGGVATLGCGMASIIPTSFIWLERHTQVTNRLSALLILSAAAGEMVIPEMVTSFIRKTPMILMYVILGVIVLCAINLVILCYVMSVRGEKYLSKPDRSLYQLANLDDDQEQWNNVDKSRQEGVIIKRNKTNTFFYDRLNNLDS